MSENNFIPIPSQQDLRAAFVGKSLHEVPLPSAILEISAIKTNCKLMLDAVAELNLGFRAHVKTHKTSELARLQVGEDCKDVRLIVSTVIEAESLIPLLKKYQDKGSKVNVLYGIPLGPSKVTRLAAVARQLGPGSITAMIDHPAQLSGIIQFKQEAGFPILVFIKTDSGYHRAGLPPTSNPMIDLVQKVVEAENNGDLDFLGFYGHNSLSYGGDNPDDAMKMLKLEIEMCQQATSNLSTTTTRKKQTPLVISVGASPSALSIQNIQPSSKSTDNSSSSTAQTLLHTIQNVPHPFTLEIHAGVYPVLDLQQLAANSRPTSSPLSAHRFQALTILTEIASTYPTRTSQPEALISSGTLALGREPCKSYPGWGVVTSWNLDREGKYTEEMSVDREQRIIVKRVSQEHGVLGWDAQGKIEELPLSVGDRVRLWINHACIAGVGFGWYLVVDEGKGKDGELVVEDVWVRWRGW